MDHEVADIKKTRIQGMLLMFCCTALWSANGVLTKLIPWDPIALAGWRGLFSGLVVLLYMRIKRIAFARNRKSLGIGLCSFMAAWTCVLAHRLTTSANAIVLQYTSPIFFMLLSVCLYKRKFRLQDYGVVAAVIGGVVLFFMDNLSPGNIWGNLSGLFCGLAYGAMFLFTGEADAGERLSGILLGAALTFFLCAPFAFFMDCPVSLPNISLIAAMGMLFHGFPYVLYCLSFQHCPSMAIVLISTAEILLNPLWVFLVVGEQPGFYALIGSCVIVVSVTAWNVAGPARTAAPTMCRENSE